MGINLEILSDQCKIVDVFNSIKDPRSKFGKQFNLGSILAVAFRAILCGCNSYEAIHDWCKSLSEKELLLFNLGKPRAPSPSFFQKTFRLMNMHEIEIMLMNWFSEYKTIINKIIALDGKFNRGSKSVVNHDRGVLLLTMVIHDCKEVVFQTQAAPGVGEITAAREMLDYADIKNCIITADAAHTQELTAKKIVIDKESDFFL